MQSIEVHPVKHMAIDFMASYITSSLTLTDKQSLHCLCTSSLLSGLCVNLCGPQDTAWTGVDLTLPSLLALEGTFVPSADPALLGKMLIKDDTHSFVITHFELTFFLEVPGIKLLGIRL